jgi:cathepsin C
MWAVLVCVAALALSGAEADTPANCTNTLALGTWEFRLGPNNNDKTLNCSSFAVDDAASVLFITLEYPDAAYDQNHNRGFWTFVYNQGFEVVINNVKYFA